jgi:sorbitol-6-phosphate 2-dehydrogenase
MNKAGFFAPLVRGAIISASGIPWTVSYDAGGNSAPVPGLVSITVNDREAADGRLFAAPFGRILSAGKIPCRVAVVSGGETYLYCTAPDFAGIEKVKNGSQKEPWNVPPSGAVNRADVVKNRVALVTGGAQGFGEELSRGLAANGAVVFIADLNMEGAEKLARILNEEYKKTTAFPVAVNVSDEASVMAMTETIALTAGGLDLCVSNAGVLRAASILEQDISSFKFVTEVNYIAFAVVSKHCALLMKGQNQAAPGWNTDIIQINSKSGLDGSNKNGSYAGSKFGGIGLVQSFAKELVAYHIKVNAVCPGNFLDGPLWSDPDKGLFVQYLKTGKVPGAKTIQDVRDFYESRVPMNRGCRGRDVLRALLYAVEQEYETGQAIPVTGGQLMLS